MANLLVIVHFLLVATINSRPPVQPVQPFSFSHTFPAPILDARFPLAPPAREKELSPRRRRASVPEDRRSKTKR